jgi:hypothetical protein
MLGGSGLGAVRQMARLLHDLDRDFRNLSRLRHAPIGVGSPKSFARYHDPQARFEFGYPSEWKLKRDGGIQVSSERMGSFARVDLVPAGTDFWSFLERAVDQEGGTFRMDSHRGARARGEIRMDGLRFAWDGTVYALGDSTLALTLGNVLDSKRSAAIEAYEDRILAAIRRSFKLGPGLRPS